MARLIDADALDRKIVGMTNEPAYLHTGEDWLNGLCMAMAIVNEAPTVDAVPVVHSEWIPVDDDGDPGDTKCKRCGCYHHVWEAFGYYCQHCGAKMDGGKKDAN